MADMEIETVKKILRGDKIIVNVESIIPDIIVVSFVNGVKTFQGALLNVNKRNLPCGINSPEPTLDRDRDKLATLATRFTYFQEKNNSTISSPSSSAAAASESLLLSTSSSLTSAPKIDLHKNLNPLPKIKNTGRPTVRLRPRQVLCNKCRSICNEQNENIGLGKKRKQCNDKPDEHDNINSISAIGKRNERRCAPIQHQTSKNRVNEKIIPSLIPKISQLDSMKHDGKQSNQLEDKIQLCWLRSTTAGDSLKLNDSDEYLNTVNSETISLSPSSQLSQQLNDNGNDTNVTINNTKPLNNVTVSKKKTLAAADSTIKNTMVTSELQRSSRKKRSIGSMENLWDGNIFEDIIKSTSVAQVTPVIKISFGTHGEGTVLKIPPKMKKLSDNIYDDNKNQDNSKDVNAVNDNDDDENIKLNETLSLDKIIVNGDTIESQIDLQKPLGKDVACAKAAKRALKKAKKEARRKMVNSGDGLSPARSPLNASPRYNSTYDPLLYHRRKHKVKHKKKHKDERKQHKNQQLKEDLTDDSTSKLTPIVNESQEIQRADCNIFPNGESYTAIKEQCLKQKLSISLKRLNANAYTRCDYPISNASSGCKSPGVSSEELSEPEQEQSSENNVDTSDNIGDFSTPHPLAIRFAATPVAHCLTATGRRMDVGDIVWGKIHGFPWWPGKVLSISISCKDDGTSGGAQAHVAWYGSSTCSLMSCDRLSPFLETFKARYNKKKRGPYKEAIRQAQSEAQIQMSTHLNNENVSNISLPSRIPSSLSVAAVDVVLTPAVCHSSPSHSILTLTPGRTRNIDQDMEALRLSRQDNPFLQILASRESLIESIDESESDDAILMSHELGDTDPLTLAQVHEHLVRSPPPASWPHATTFAFNSNSITCGNSAPETCYKHSPSKSNSYKEHTSDINLLSQSEPSNNIRDRQTHSFSLLNPTPIRTLSEVRRLHRSADDNVQLMSSE